jgi:hypothetical protein
MTELVILAAVYLGAYGVMVLGATVLYLGLTGSVRR